MEPELLSAGWWRDALSASQDELLHKPMESLEMRIGGERYLASSVQLQAATATDGGVQLVVLKSFAEEEQILARLNRLIAALSVLAALLGMVFAALISKTVTRPMESLVTGTRALSRGDFTHQVREEGAMEVRELSRAFDRMRRQMQKAQEELLAAERMATIGQMASSISHDLRHYLSAVYANAEFLANPRISSGEREELFEDIRGGVQGMTEMLDSLLVFGRTGMQLRLRSESLVSLVDRTAAAVRLHPDARGVDLRVQPVLPLKIEVDERGTSPRSVQPAAECLSGSPGMRVFGMGRPGDCDPRGWLVDYGSRQWTGDSGGNSQFSFSAFCQRRKTERCWAGVGVMQTYCGGARWKNLLRGFSLRRNGIHSYIASGEHR